MARRNPVTFLMSEALARRLYAQEAPKHVDTTHTWTFSEMFEARPLGVVRSGEIRIAGGIVLGACVGPAAEAAWLEAEVPRD